MSHTKKRFVLATLSRTDILLLGKAFGLPMSQRLPLDELLKVLETSGRAQIHAILPELPDTSLAKVGKALGIAEGRGRDALIAAIREATGDAPAPVPSPQAVQMLSTAGTSAPAAVPEAPEAPAPEPPAPRAGKAADVALAIEVEPRKPRLAWQGMDRRERAVSVPTQVVEVVRAGRAVDRGDSLLNTEARAASAAKAGNALPPNRLIWTNDNLVALTTLLHERDAVTKDYKYQGKVDLIYIDPPFMVNNDFRADNTIDIDIDGDAGVQATKEPSLVEILAYKDTWRQGLDSFLTMLRTRLELLKKLLAPTGSIYVHLDWHAVHYVKVMMDEVFGYENFLNEIIWKRTSARSDASGFNHVHDTLLVYGASKSAYWQVVNGPYATDYIRSHYNQIDPATKRRFMLDNLTSPNPRPNMMYPWRGCPPPTNGWRYSIETMTKMDDEGLIFYPPEGGRPRFKRLLDDEGVEIQPRHQTIVTLDSSPTVTWSWWR